MAYLLGVDTGGTYTDAVLMDEAATRVIGKAKALTTRRDLAQGIGAAVDAALAARMVAAQATRAQRLAMADDVVVNDGMLAELEAAVRRLHGRYLGLAG